MSENQKIKELIDQLDDFEMNLTARYQLASMGAAVLPTLLKALADDPREMVRQWIVDVLAKMKAQEAVPALLKALKEDEFEGVRSVAAGALAVIGGNPEEIVPALAKALKEDKSDRVTRTVNMHLNNIAKQLGYSSIEELIKAF